MPIRITCPACKTVNSVSDDKRGKRVRCKECEKALNVPEALGKNREEEAIQEHPRVTVKPAAKKRRDDETDDQPVKKKPKAIHKSGAPLFLILGGVAVCALLGLLVVIGGAAYFIFRSAPAPIPAIARADDLPKQPLDGGAENKKPEPKKDGKVDPNPNPVPKAEVKPPVDPKVNTLLPDQMAPETVGRVKRATVYLQVTLPSGKKAEGSGFFTMQPGIVVTNAHVLGMLQSKSQLPRQVEVTLHSGEAGESKRAGQVLGVDHANDLAVLRVAGDNLPEPLRLEAEHKPVETQKVFIFGFPFGASLGKNITVSASAISSLRLDGAGSLEQIQVNGGMNPGNSGGPVVNSLGNLVGVAVSGIRGTQINFAIPSDFVTLVMDGRLADTKVGEAYAQNGQTLLPMKYSCLDPLNKIRELRVEVWTGMPGQPRPISMKQPEARPGDSPRKSINLTYQNGAAASDVSLPPVQNGEVCWLQPVVISASGKTHWGAAYMTPTSLLPVERTSANLTIDLFKLKERTVQLKSKQGLIALKGKEKISEAVILDADILELMSPGPTGALMRTNYGKTRHTVTVNDKRLPTIKRHIDLFRLVPPIFQVDGMNNVKGRTDRSLNTKTVDFQTREQVQEMYTQLCNSLEAAMLPIPNRQLKPQESWPTKMPMLLTGSQGGRRPEVADLMLTCTFEGTRKRDQRLAGVLSVAGRVQGRGANIGRIQGEATGTFEFDTEGGFISLAQLNITSEFEVLGGEIQLVTSFDVHLTRQAGNPMAIPAPQEPKPLEPTPTPKVKVMLAQNGTLLPTDPIDSDTKNSRRKIHYLYLYAGKTYVISLNSSTFDPVLRLENSKGQIIAQDDDSGGQLNARIIYRATQTGNHRFVATSFDSKTGPYQLVLAEAR